MRRLLRGLSRTALALAVLTAASVAAQDYPVEVPGRARDTGPAAPEGIALPGPPPPPELVTPLSILGRLVVPGTREQLEWRPRGGISSAEMASPVIVTRGALPGPVLCLTAGIHGDEINGVEIVRRLSHSVDPARLSGTVIGVPIVNVFGYSRGSRYLPDRRDLNRFFPGSRGGSIASRLAHAFFEDIVRHCDAIVDFHTGSFDRSNLPQVRADLTNPEVLEFSRGFGATVVLHSPGSRGMLRVAATAVGIPAVTFEAGAPARLETAEIAEAVAAIDRLMHKQAMLEAPAAPDALSQGVLLVGPQAAAEPAAEPAPIFLDSRWVRANSGGLLISEVGLGERVAAGQRLGRVIDPVSNVERFILAPVPGRVIGMAENQAVLPGYAAFHLGTETSEQQAVREAALPQALEPVAEDPAYRRESAEGALGEDFE